MLIGMANANNDRRGEPRIRSIGTECNVVLPSRCGASDCTTETCNPSDLRVRFTLTAGQGYGFPETLEIDGITDITHGAREIPKPPSGICLRYGTEWDSIHDIVHDLVREHCQRAGITTDHEGGQDV